MSRPLLKDSLPELAEELRKLLKKKGAPELADQIAALRLVDRCRCSDESCATFYTAAKSQWEWGPKHENIDLNPKRGFLTVNFVENEIVSVEVLSREEVRKKLLQLLP